MPLPDVEVGMKMLHRRIKYHWGLARTKISKSPGLTISGLHCGLVFVIPIWPKQEYNAAKIAVLSLAALSLIMGRLNPFVVSTTNL